MNIERRDKEIREEKCSENRKKNKEKTKRNQKSKLEFLKEK